MLRARVLQPLGSTASDKTLYVLLDVSTGNHNHLYLPPSRKEGFNYCRASASPLAGSGFVGTKLDYGVNAVVRELSFCQAVHTCHGVTKSFCRIAAFESGSANDSTVRQRYFHLCRSSRISRLSGRMCHSSLGAGAIRTKVEWPTLDGDPLTQFI